MTETSDHADRIYDVMSGAARDVAAQLFLRGPTWDGHVIAKSGRDELVRRGFAKHENGWAFLTDDGVRFCVNTTRCKDWSDKRWYRKQQAID